MASGFIPIAPVEEGLRKILSGEYRQYPRAHEIVDFSLYGEHLERYAKTFHRDRLTVSLLDDLRADRASELARLYRAIGVDDSYQPKASGGRPMQAIYSLPRLRMRVWMGRSYRGYGEQGEFTYFRRGPLAKACRYTASVIDKFIMQPLLPAKPPKLSAELQAALQERFVPDIERLEAWLGRDLSEWKEEDQSKSALDPRTIAGARHL